MKTKMIRVFVIAFTLASIGYMSISAQDATGTGGSGLVVSQAAEELVPAGRGITANPGTDANTSGGGGIATKLPTAKADEFKAKASTPTVTETEQPEESGGCCG